MGRRPTETLTRMRSYATDLPRHFSRGFADGTELAQQSRGMPDRATYVVGMGGAGAAGEFVHALVRRESPVHYECLHSPELPAAVGPRCRVVLLSYSGDTWEVLRAGEEARRRGARQIVVTSGGELRERAESQGDPLLLLPPDLPPRSAIGYTFGGLLGFLDGGFPESLEPRVSAARAELEAFRSKVDGADGIARRIVRDLGSRLPIIYSEPALQAVGHRWATSFEENAKRFATVDGFPEALLDGGVGWEAGRSVANRSLAGVVLDWGGSLPEFRNAGESLRRSLTRSGAKAVDVRLPSEDLLGALLQGIMLGDFVSLALAQAAGTDPLPINGSARSRGGRDHARAEAAAPAARGGPRTNRHIRPRLHASGC